MTDPQTSAEVDQQEYGIIIYLWKVEKMLSTTTEESCKSANEELVAYLAARGIALHMLTENEGEELIAHLATRGMVLHMLTEDELESGDYDGPVFGGCDGCDDPETDNHDYFYEYEDEEDDLTDMTIDEIAETYGIYYALWYVGNPHLM